MRHIQVVNVPEYGEFFLTINNFFLNTPTVFFSLVARIL